MGLWITSRMCTRRNFLLFVCSLQLVNILSFSLLLLFRGRLSPFSLHDPEKLAAAVWPAKRIFISNILSIGYFVAFFAFAKIPLDHLCILDAASFRSVNFINARFSALSTVNLTFDCESCNNGTAKKKTFSYKLSRERCFASINFKKRKTVHIKACFCGESSVSSFFVLPRPTISSSRLTSVHGNETFWFLNLHVFVSKLLECFTLTTALKRNICVGPNDVKSIFDCSRSNA